MKLIPINDLDITNRTLLLKEHLVTERIRHCIHTRLVAATAGFGCKPDSGGKVFVHELFGEKPWGSGQIVPMARDDDDGFGTWRRPDFEGIVAEDDLRTILSTMPIPQPRLDPNNVVLFAYVNGKYTKADSQLRLLDKLRVKTLKNAFVAVVHAEAILDELGRLSNPPGARAPVVLQEPGGKPCFDVQSEYEQLLGTPA